MAEDEGKSAQVDEHEGHGPGSLKCPLKHRTMQEGVMGDGNHSKQKEVLDVLDVVDVVEVVAHVDVWGERK